MQEPRYTAISFDLGGQQRSVAMKAENASGTLSETFQNDSGAEPELALKAVDADEGLLIFKVSKAGNFDRERERVTLPALKAATYELVRNIGHDKCEVDINHAEKAEPCDIVMAWIGYPMPDENAAYVALRPHDRKIVEAAKAGHVVGASWAGPYRLKDAVL